MRAHTHMLQGAEEMHEMELALNQYAAKVARGHCAHFIGYCTVTEKEATASLTPGMWLVRMGRVLRALGGGWGLWPGDSQEEGLSV